MRNIGRTPQRRTNSWRLPLTPEDRRRENERSVSRENMRREFLSGTAPQQIAAGYAVGGYGVEDITRMCPTVAHHDIYTLVLGRTIDDRS